MRKKKLKKRKVSKKEREDLEDFLNDEDEDEDEYIKESRKRKSKSKRVKNKSFQEVLKSSSLAILFFLIGAVVLLSSFSAAGKVGATIFSFLEMLFGWVAYILFVGFMWLGYDIWKVRNNAKLNLLTSLAFFVLLFAITGFTASIGLLESSGKVGSGMYIFLENYFGNILPAVFSLALGLISFIIIYQDKPSLFNIFRKRKRLAEEDLANQMNYK